MAQEGAYISGVYWNGYSYCFTVDAYWDYNDGTIC